MATRDWAALQRLRFFALLKEARSLKRHGLDVGGRFTYLCGYMAGFDDGQFRGFEQGIFHFLPVNNIQEALQCSRQLNAESSVRAGKEDAEPTGAVNATPGSK